MIVCEVKCVHDRSFHAMPAISRRHGFFIPLASFGVGTYKSLRILIHRSVKMSV